MTSFSALYRISCTHSQFKKTFHQSDAFALAPPGCLFFSFVYDAYRDFQSHRIKYKKKKSFTQINEERYEISSNGRIHSIETNRFHDETWKGHGMILEKRKTVCPERLPFVHHGQGRSSSDRVCEKNLDLQSSVGLTEKSNGSLILRHLQLLCRFVRQFANLFFSRVWFSWKLYPELCLPE